MKKYILKNFTKQNPKQQHQKKKKLNVVKVTWERHMDTI